MGGERREREIRTVDEAPPVAVALRALLPPTTEHASARTAALRTATRRRAPRAQ